MDLDRHSTAGGGGAPDHRDRDRQQRERQRSVVAHNRNGGWRHDAPASLIWWGGQQVRLGFRSGGLRASFDGADGVAGAWTSDPIGD